jgi:hypothetical protein
MYVCTIVLILLFQSDALPIRFVSNHRCKIRRSALETAMMRGYSISLLFVFLVNHKVCRNSSSNTTDVRIRSMRSSVNVPYNNNSGIEFQSRLQKKMNTTNSNFILWQYRPWPMHTCVVS